MADERIPETSEQASPQTALGNGPGRSPVPAPRKKEKAPPPPEPKDNLREVVETIVFVVVLVLILKSFAAEAFVIPTGSMAETLWGYQRKVECPQCGFEFPVNVSRQVDPQEQPAASIVACTCPNCRYHITFNPHTADWSSGDRVLVAKFLWDTGLKHPERFDITVFKYPERPQPKQTPMNYIKRTAGLGTETIGIYYGKLYMLPGLKYDESLVNPLNLWQRQHMHVDDFSDLLKHERAFHKLFDAVLETAADDDLKHAVEHRAEINRVLHQLARYRDQSRYLASALESGGDAGTLANQLLERNQDIRSSLEAQPGVEPLLSNLRDELTAMDTALGNLASKLRQRKDADAFGPLLRNDTEGKKLLGTLLDHKDELTALRDQGQLRFQVLRRRPDKLLSMRRIVFDNDFQPKDLATQPARWEMMTDDGAAANAGWTRSDDRKVYEHAAGAPGPWHWLRYQHRLRVPGKPLNVSEQPELITDFMGYNSYEENPPTNHAQPSDWVGDLLLECEATVTAAEGELVLQLSKGQDRFEAHWNLQDGTCTLRHLTYDVAAGEGDKLAKPREQKDLARQSSPLNKPGTYKLRFANVDERLIVWVDGKLLFGDGVEYSTPERRGPFANDLQPASIGVQNAAVKVQHLQLWRDTYYTSQLFADGGRREPDVAVDKDGLSKPEAWGPLRDRAARTMYVQPDHYLCLGDNSPESSDSRYWGTVPERSLLGRALLIYYPFTRAGRIK